MSRKKIKNPLIKRIPKEIIGDWKKYLVVFLFLVLTIGFVSGMYVANDSMLTSADEGVSKYKQEDGHFELKDKADSELVTAIESGEVKTAPDKKDSDSSKTPVTLYENFYRNEDEDYDADGKKDGTIRVYTKTGDINLACLIEGSFPQNENEIAVDRMHADNVGMKVGDTIKVSGKEFEVSGLIAYVNYSTLHEKKTDMMFDAIKFDVAMVTKEGFERLNKSIHYTYAWKYEDEPADDIEQKEKSDDFLEAMVSQVMAAGNEVEDYTPRYSNPAINFATDDMGSDKAMGGVLLDILIVIIAFIFAVTISNTIVNESSAIGTLRASGYTKGELIRHYLSMPVIVTFLAAVVGNILGYTVFKDVVVGMYYNSYSLPTYHTIWNPGAFIKTTLAPVIIMLVVNLIVIIRMMQHTPLQFLRHDLKKTKRKKAMRLPRLSFMSRFRLRIMFQNVANYLILFVGIFFIMVMLAMAVGMPDTLDYYKKNTDSMMFAKYQYVLKSYVDADGNVLETDNSDAEKFDMTSLLRRTDEFDEEVSVYGVETDSAYVKLKDIRAMHAGKNVISEKPVTLSSSDLQEMENVAKETGKFLTVHQNRRWDDDFLIIRKLVEEQKLGHVFRIESRVHGSRGIPGDWRKEKVHGGGMVLDWGVHLLDQILYLYGDRKIETVYASLTHITNQEVDDGFTTILTFEGGTEVLVEVGTNNYISLPRWYVLGEDGTAVIRDWQLNGEIIRKTGITEEKVVPVKTAAGLTKTMAPRREDTIVKEELPHVSGDIADFHRNVAAVIRDGAEPEIKLFQVMRVMKLMEAIFQSAETNKVIDYRQYES